MSKFSEICNPIFEQVTCDYPLKDNVDVFVENLYQK